MPIPFLFIGLGVATAALGVGKGIKAGVDQKEAKDVNESAQYKIDTANKKAASSRESCGRSIEALGQKKVSVLNGSVDRFITLFEQIHNVELSESDGLDELKKFCIDKQSFGELREMSAMAASIAGGFASGAAGGALAALGAYGGAMTFGAASTGTAIATLSGAAATNATLAFFGGGSLAAGGLGIAGGTAVLGGLVAGPALAIMGFIVGAKASANKDRAYANYAEAEKFEEEVKTLQVLCKGIRMRADMFKRLLIKLDVIFDPMLDSLDNIIAASGNDFTAYTPEEKKTVGACLAFVKAIKAVLDTPILTNEGCLTEESESIIAPVQDVIQTHGNN